MEIPSFYLDSNKSEPVLNVQIFNGKKYIDFKFDDMDFDIVDNSGKQILTGINKNRLWRIKAKKNTPAIYPLD